MTKEFRSGVAAILGKPNVGKSTLMNRIVGEKIAIVSAKPQTTRDRLMGIHTTDAAQIVFVDAPGVIEPRDAFNEILMAEALQALDGADVVLHIVDAQDPAPAPPWVRRIVRAAEAPAFLLVNKIDLLSEAVSVEEKLTQYDATGYERVFAVSAVTGQGVDEMLAAIVERLPEGPPLYDPGQICDRDLRYLAAERVREKVFELTRQEIPYGVATRTAEFREQAPPDKTYIRVEIFVERESQKGILLGKGAATLKQIGLAARGEIERLMGEPVFLELSVKTRKNWRKSESALREFGYRPPRRQTRGDGGRPRGRRRK